MIEGQVNHLSVLIREVLGHIHHTEGLPGRALILNPSNLTNLDSLVSLGWMIDIAFHKPTNAETLNPAPFSRHITIIDDLAKHFTTGPVYNLVIIDRYLNFLPRSEWQKLLVDLKRHTAVAGWHAIYADADDITQPVTSDADYLFSPREIRQKYQKWHQAAFYTNSYSFQMPGPLNIERKFQVLYLQKLGDDSQALITAGSLLRSLIISLCLVVLATSLCTWGYLSLGPFSLTTLWPGAVFQALGSITLGGWGIIASILTGALTDIVRLDRPGINLWFAAADLVETLIPAFYYRCLLIRGGWNAKQISLFRFLIWAIILPRIAGSFFGAMGILTMVNGSLFRFMCDWFLSGVPIGLIVGWPIYRVLMPHFVREGWALKGWWR